MNLCTVAKKAIQKGIKRGDAVQILNEIDYHKTSIATLERAGIFYIEQIFMVTTSYLLINVFSGKKYRLTQLRRILNKYHTITCFPPDDLKLDISGYNLTNFEYSHKSAQVRFERGEEPYVGYRHWS